AAPAVILRLTQHIEGAGSARCVEHVAINQRNRLGGHLGADRPNVFACFAPRAMEAPGDSSVAAAYLAPCIQAGRRTRRYVGGAPRALLVRFATRNKQAAAAGASLLYMVPGYRDDLRSPQTGIEGKA